MSLRFLLGAMLLALATAVNMDDCAVGNVNDRLRAGAASRRTSGPLCTRCRPGEYQCARKGQKVRHGNGSEERLAHL